MPKCRMTKVLLGQCSAEMAHQRMHHRFGTSLPGEYLLQRRAVLELSAEAEQLKLFKGLGHVTLIAPGIACLLHGGLGMALRSTIAPQRRDCGMNAHRCRPIR
jgi:hypothetical protein